MRMFLCLCCAGWGWAPPWTGRTERPHLSWAKIFFISRWKELGRILQQNTRLKQLPFHVTQYRKKDVVQSHVYYIYSIFISIENKKNYCSQVFVFFIWHFCISCVEVGKVKFNEIYTPKEVGQWKWHFPKRGKFVDFFLLLLSLCWEVNFFPKFFFFFFHCEK